MMQVLPLRFLNAFVPVSSLQQEIAYFTLDENTWEVHTSSSNGRVWVRHGWKCFMRDNALMVGDRLCFQLVEKDEVQFYVAIHR